MKHLLLFSLIAAMGVACQPDGSSSSDPAPGAEPASSGSHESSGSTASTGAAAPASTGTTSESAQPAAGTSSPSKSASGAIEVTAPGRQAEVDHSIRIEGKARVFENRVNYRLRADGRVLAEGSTLANAPDVGQFGPFDATLTWAGEGMAPGTGAELEVYATSPKDGTPDHVVSIPVKLK